MEGGGKSGVAVKETETNVAASEPTAIVCSIDCAAMRAEEFCVSEGFQSSLSFA